MKKQSIPRPLLQHIPEGGDWGRGLVETEENKKNRNIGKFLIMVRSILYHSTQFLKY